MVPTATLVARGAIMTPTSLKIQGAGMPSILLEECTQTLETIALGGLHRTVNGELIYTGTPEMTKYKSTCVGCGQGAPGLDALKRGDAVTVQCIQRLWQEVNTAEITLARPSVAGTVLLMDEKRQLVTFNQISATKIGLEEAPLMPLYLSYCPVLNMRILEMTFNVTEWDNKATWKVILEEV